MQVARCAMCGADLVPGAKFCMQCGAAQSKNCPECGSEVSPAAKFCMKCGTKLS